MSVKSRLSGIEANDLWVDSSWLTSMSPQRSRRQRLFLSLNYICPGVESSKIIRTLPHCSCFYWIKPHCVEQPREQREDILPAGRPLDSSTRPPAERDWTCKRLNDTGFRDHSAASYLYLHTHTQGPTPPTQSPQWHV